MRENTLANEAKIIFKHISARCCPAVRIDTKLSVRVSKGKYMYRD